MKVNKDASDRAFGKVDLDYFVQSSIDNAENEEELDTEVKIFQNALDFSNIKIRDYIVSGTIGTCFTFSCQFFGARNISDEWI